MCKKITVLFILMCLTKVKCQDAFISGLVSIFENSADEFFSYVKGWLDGSKETAGDTETHRYFSPRMDPSSKSLKKMGMSLMPLIFHVGATSTWMILTSLLAAKSVAIGLAILVFKIAVSSAKVASFFTSFKAKHSSHHQDWSWSPPSHEYGHDRSYTGDGIPTYADNYQPYWPPTTMKEQERSQGEPITAVDREFKTKKDE